MPDTRKAERTHPSANERPVFLACALGAAWLVFFLITAGPAWPEPAAVRARVAWARADRVYLAAEDSLSLEAGDLVRFVLRGRTVATGIVARTFDHELAAVTLSSGSVASERNWRRLRIVSERPPLPPAPLLRVGVPAAIRSTRFLDCARLDFLPQLPSGSYADVEVNDRGVRLVRDPGVRLAAPWPDTLLVRFFDDAADQEIALERGELDVAVFWPGELSRHMREQSRWQDHLVGTRTPATTESLGQAGDATAALRCPVVCEARLLPYLRSLGADALVQAIACRPADREP